MFILRKHYQNIVKIIFYVKKFHVELYNNHNFCAALQL